MCTVKEMELCVAMFPSWHFTDIYLLNFVPEAVVSGLVKCDSCVHRAQSNKKMLADAIL